MLRIFIAIIGGLITSFSMFLLSGISNVWFFLLVIAIWFSLLSLGYFYIYQKSHHKWLNFILLITTLISLTCLLLFIEWPPLQYMFFVLGGLVTAFLFSRLPQPGIVLEYQQKPLRRGIMMLWVFDVYVLFSSLFALNIYFPVLPFWFLALAGGIIAFFLTILVWRNYLDNEVASLLFWAGVVSLTMAQILWVLHLLPLGHFSLGAVAVWFWYVAVLLFRFNFVEQGIVWRKQIFFLLSNAILLFLFLFFLVRWI